MALPVGAIVKAVTSALSSEKGRKVIGGIVLLPVALVILILLVFFGLIAGLFMLLFGAVTDTAVNQSWTQIQMNVSAALDGVNNTISGQIHDTVYDFMPDFSINLSKSVLQKSFSDGNASFLLLYDTGEAEQSDQIIKETISKLKAVNTQAELDEITKDTQSEGFLLSDLKADTAFLADATNDTSLYSDGVQQLLLSVAKAALPNYGYDYEELTIDGKQAKKQTLTVENNGVTEIVEYICYGEGDIYLPKMMALYQVDLFEEFQDASESNASELDNELESAVGEIDETSGTDFAATDNGFDLATLDLFQAHEMGNIFQQAALDGKIGAKVEKEERADYRKLTVTVTTPTEDEWLQLFGVDDENKEMVEDYQNVIEQTLSDAGVTNLSISVDTTAQKALFCYFQGFFNLPVESSDLRPYTNGILTTLGDYQEFHQNGGVTATQKSYEAGITLNLAEADTEVRAEILPNVGDVIYDVYIYDVYDANSPDRYVVKDSPSYTYNCCAVQLAYLIDTDEFERVYGFEFPEIVMTNGDILEHEDGLLTLFVEYSCLDRLENIMEQDIGRSLYDIYRPDEPIVIGYAHSGKHDAEKDEGSGLLFWRHMIGSEEMPHLSVKMSFVEGEIVPDEWDTVHTYNGLSVDFVGAKVNPLLWFKAYRTDINNDMLNTLVPLLG